MGRFISILIATFISVLAALASWHYAEAYLARMVAEDAAKDVVAGNQFKYEWKSEVRTNPVTGAKAATATRFSEDTKAAITFRCHGDRSFDVLVSFPDAVEWSSYRGDSFSSMEFRIDGGKLFKILADRSSSSVAVPNLSSYLKDEPEVREFKKIGKAKKFEASISDGTIYDQTLSIDLDGIEDALAPVLSLCGKSGV
jgi:hypothetical protein